MLTQARSSISCATSTSCTVKPACANTWAMPCPIVPAPTTPMDLISEGIFVSFVPSWFNLDSLHRERDAVAAAQAQRRDAALQIALFQRVEQGRQDASRRSIRWRAQARRRRRSRSPCAGRCRVPPGPRPPAPKTLRSARRDPRPRAASRSSRRSARTASTGVISTNFGARPLVACPTMRASGSRPSDCARSARHHDERGGAVVDAGRIAGGDRAVLLEGGLQGAERRDRGVRADRFVAIDDERRRRSAAGPTSAGSRRGTHRPRRPPRPSDDCAAANSSCGAAIDMVVLGDHLAGVPHVALLERAPQAVLNHRIQQLAVSHAQPFAHAREQVRALAH